jgi:hypothetical protein
MKVIEQSLSFTHPAVEQTTSGLTPEQASLRAARRSLRAQIARLERELSDTLVTAFDAGLRPGPGSVADPLTAPRLLDLAELEQQRDELTWRLQRARSGFAGHAEEDAQRRQNLERMLADPAAYPFGVVRLRAPGERNCGAYQVRPRHGLIGMLRGWWQVKISSGCPLPRGRGAAPRPAQ